MTETTKEVQAERITLGDWATRVYGDKAPHINTLRNWTAAGRITPQPEKHGKTWFVFPYARYVGGR